MHNSTTLSPGEKRQQNVNEKKTVLLLDYR